MFIALKLFQEAGNPYPYKNVLLLLWSGRQKRISNATEHLTGETIAISKMYYHLPKVSAQSICLEIASESTSIVNLQEND